MGDLRDLETLDVYLFRRIRHLRVVAKRRMRLGRGRGCDIRIADDHVSECHATILRQRDGGYLLQDERSRNGLWARDPLEPGERYRKMSWVALTLGMHLRVGRTRFLDVDAEGLCVISANSSAEFCHKARRIYGSPEAACELAGVDLELPDISVFRY